MTDLHTRLANLWHTTHTLAVLASMLGVTERTVRKLASDMRLPYAPRMSIGVANAADRAAIAEDYMNQTPNLTMQREYHLSASQMLRIPAQLHLNPRGYILTKAQMERLEALFTSESSLADIAKRIKLPVCTLREWYEARLEASKARPVVQEPEPLAFGKFASEQQMRAAAERWGRMQKADVAAAIGMSLTELSVAITSVQRLNRLFPRAAYRRGVARYNPVEPVQTAPVAHESYQQPAQWYDSPWIVPSVADCFGYPLAQVSQAACLLSNRPLYAGIELFALLAMTQWLEEGTCPLHPRFQSLHIVSSCGTPCTPPPSGVTTDALLKTPVLAYQITEMARSDTRRLRHVVSVDFCLLRTIGNLTPAATRTPLGVVPAGVRVVLTELR